MKQFSPKSYNEYMEVMKVNKVEVIPCINKAGKLQGFRFKFDGYNLKGSAIDRSMSIGNIGKQMAATIGVERFAKKQHAVSDGGQNSKTLLKAGGKYSKTCN